MELWIRSQDKMALSKFDLLILEKEVKGYMFIADHYKNMGVYSTKERALEVLDDIQKLLMPQVIIKSIDTSVEIANLNHIVNPSYETIQQLNTYVYEMPKE